MPLLTFTGGVDYRILDVEDGVSRRLVFKRGVPLQVSGDDATRVMDVDAARFTIAPEPEKAPAPPASPGKRTTHTPPAKEA